MLSHNIVYPGKTTALGAFATWTFPSFGHNGAKSAIRAYELLELFVQLDRPVRATEAAKYLGVSPSSMIQILKTMVDYAYLIFDPKTKEYYPSPRLANFAHWFSSKYFTSQSLQRLMSSVQALSGEMVTLSTRQDWAMQIIDVDHPIPCELLDKATDDEIPPPAVKGQRVSLFGSANGTAWLSTQDDQTVLSALERCRRQVGKLADDPELVLAGIRRAANDGYSFGGLSEDDRFWALAMPLPPSATGIVLVLAVAGPASRLDAKRLTLVTTMKEKINQYVGDGW